MAASPHPAAHQQIWAVLWRCSTRCAPPYDALFEIITVDAGMTSKAHAAYVQAADRSYVMAVRDGQPELLRELQRVLMPQTEAAL